MKGERRRSSGYRSPDSWTSGVTGTATTETSDLEDDIPCFLAMAIAKAEERGAYLDLGNAVEVEDKLTRALDAVQAHSDRLKEKKEAG